jgi:hypothetical protein
MIVIVQAESITSSTRSFDAPAGFEVPLVDSVHRTGGRRRRMRTRIDEILAEADVDALETRLERQRRQPQRRRHPRLIADS